MTETWPITNMHFYPDSRTCYVIYCPTCGLTNQTRDPKPFDFVCEKCFKPMEVDFNGIPETTTIEVYQKAVHRACIRNMASRENRL